MPDQRLAPADRCPSLETLAAYVDGAMDAAARQEIQRHLAGCEVCYDIVVETARAVDELAVVAEGGDAEVIKFPRRRMALGAAAALAAAAAVILAVWIQPAWWTNLTGGRRGGIESLVAAAGSERSLEARLTGFPHRPLASATRSVAGARTTNLTLLAAAGELQQKVQSDPGPENERAWGVAQLLLNDHGGAVASLERAAAAMPDNGAVQNDLAAAYIARAQGQQRPDDWPRAVAAAERAIRLDSGGVEAWFNRALAIDGLRLPTEARRAWDDYLQRDSTSPWADEARRARDRLGKGTSWDDRLDDFRRGRESLAALIATSVLATRELGERTVLGEWAQAIRAGDADRAGVLLVTADRIGSAIRDHGGDTVLAEHTRFVHALPDAKHATLAAAHGEWMAAQEHLDAYRFAEAASRLERAFAVLQQLGAPLAIRVRAQLASVARSQRQLDVARDWALPLVNDDSEGCSVAAAEASRVLGLVAAGEGLYQVALAAYERAAGYYDRCGETSGRASADALSAEVLTILGSHERAWVYEYRALAGLHTVTAPRARMLVTYCGAELALRQGLPEAAVHLSRESIATARSARNLSGVAEATAHVARALLALDDHAATEAAITDALTLLRSEGDERHQRFVEGELLTNLAHARSLRDPGTSRDVVDAALRHARDARRSASIPPLLTASARAHLAGGAVDRARADLDEARTLFDEQLTAARDTWLRVSFREIGWRIHEERARLELDFRRDHGAALEVLFEAHQRVAHARAATVPIRTVGQIQSALPLDTRVLFVHAFRDRVALWMLTHSSVDHHSVPLPLTSLRDFTRQLIAALEGRDAPRQTALGRQAYDSFLQPFAASQASTRLLVLANAPIDQLPWAALRSGDGRWLVERSSVELVAVGGAAAAPRRVGGDSTLVLASPDAVRGVARLRLVAAEAAAIQQLRGASIVDASTARREDVLQALRGATTLHFAGHAIADPELPERSALVLRRDSSGGLLTARELSETRLQLDLAILTACRTGADHSLRSAASVSLASVLRDSGIPIVIGAVGDVRDEVAQGVGVDLHRHLAAGHSAARALQLSQLRQVRDGASADWALFTVFSTLEGA
jgi:CHAT domain-containing protein